MLECSPGWLPIWCKPPVNGPREFKDIVAVSLFFCVWHGSWSWWAKGSSINLRHPEMRRVSWKEDDLSIEILSYHTMVTYGNLGCKDLGLRGSISKGSLYAGIWPDWVSWLYCISLVANVKMLATLTPPLSPCHLTNPTASTLESVTHIKVSASWIYVGLSATYFLMSSISSSSSQESTKSTATWKQKYLALETDHHNAFGTGRVKRSVFSKY